MTETAIINGIPIPSAMPSSVEIPFDGVDDGEDEDCMGDSVVGEDNVVVVEDKVIAGKDEPKFVAEDDPD